jgi:cell wall-associated NlpC family hydrolase
MLPRPRVSPLVVAPLLVLALGACAQGSFAVSPGTILSGVILAGDVINSRSGSSGSRTTSSPSASRARLPRSPAPTAFASRVLATAGQYVGVPYVWGGNTPKSGMDCSGFTRYVFAAHGVTLPRTSREQAHAGQALPREWEALAPGDIMLFAEPGEAISHVAIYVGNGEIIHSSAAYGGVGYLDLNSSRGDWYVQNMVAARRLR